MHILEAGDVAVGPGFGTAAQHAVLQTDDHLTAAEAVGRGLDTHPVTHPLQLQHDLGVDAGLHGDAAVPHPLPARRIEALLGIEMKVDGVGHDLQVTLGLHVGAHHAEGADGSALLHQETGDDRVIAALAWLQGIGSSGIQ